jgi:hypothetical protein
MIAMTQTEYNKMADQSLEELRAETPEVNTELKQRNIQTGR